MVISKQQQIKWCRKKNEIPCSRLFILKKLESELAPYSYMFLWYPCLYICCNCKFCWSHLCCWSRKKTTQHNTTQTTHTHRHTQTHTDTHTNTHTHTCTHTHASINEDRKRRVATATETELSVGNTREAWQVIRCWFVQVENHPLPAW